MLPAKAFLLFNPITEGLTLTEDIPDNTDTTNYQIIGIIYPYVSCIGFGDKKITDLFTYHGESSSDNRKHLLTYLPQILPKIIDAMKILHGMNLVHGDIKLENILLSGNLDTGDFHVYIIDLEKAVKFNTDDCRFTYPLASTKDYAPPEILCFEAPYDGKKADIYSFGISLLALHNYQFQVADAATLDNSELVIERSKQLAIDYNRYKDCSYPYLRFVASLGRLCIKENPDHRPDMDLIAYLYSNKDNVDIHLIFEKIDAHIRTHERSPTLEEVMGFVSRK